ncbi:MAG: N-acetyl-gamma-glutamyl-phosphate reductase [Dehalococcoidia bacterium]|nr:N-acetyl-gamma-glutamyl-phosphate reductase [Dehalococcoidia bacterium]
MTVKVGIINVTGYVGMELARLLHHHPRVELASITGRSAVGQRLGVVLPHLADIDMLIEPELGEVTLVFSVLPHRMSAEAVAEALGRGIKVIDISADFRLKEAEGYQKWYDFAHPAPQLLGEAVYGLVELNRQRITSSRLVANPGCYPTSAILALAPAVREGLIEPDIVIDAKSGVSGAGRTLSMGTHFAEVNENVSAYALEGHRHLPEITQELGGLNPALALSVTFVPHLVPMSRGILTTCYAKLKEGREGQGELEKGMRELYREFYRDEPFIRVVDAPPQTKQTLGTNLCLIYPTIDPRTQRLIIVSCIDNLVKGGAGQALQSMNLMLGLPEGMALEGSAVYP